MDNINNDQLKLGGFPPILFLDSNEKKKREFKQ